MKNVIINTQILSAIFYSVKVEEQDAAKISIFLNFSWINFELTSTK